MKKSRKDVELLRKITSINEELSDIESDFDGDDSVLSKISVEIGDESIELSDCEDEYFRNIRRSRKIIRTISVSENESAMEVAETQNDAESNPIENSIDGEWQILKEGGSSGRPPAHTIL